jgi:osmotically-inducible protein OsmY
MTAERCEDDGRFGQGRHDRQGHLGQEGRVGPDTSEVTVKDGVVTLAGRPETCEVGQQIVRRVRHLLGVVAVRHRLSYPVK